MLVHFSVNSYWLTDIQARVANYVAQLCTQKEGFVLDVQDVVISNVRASPQGNLICEAQCKVKTYLPQAGQVVTARVQKIMPGTGVYCVYQKADMLIPWRAVPPDFNASMVRIKIEQVRYQNGKYRSVAMINE